MRNGCGVYIIKNNKTGDCYVGSSVDMNKRGNIHFDYLRKNKHDNLILQLAYNSYGFYFDFLVAMYCEPFERLRYEQFFIDTLKPKYNQSPTAGTNKGYKYNRKKRQKLMENLDRIQHSNNGLGESICCHCKQPFPPRIYGSTWFYCAKCMNYFNTRKLTIDDQVYR